MLPSCTAVAVTICGVVQFVEVKVSVAGDTVTAGSSLATEIVGFHG